MRTSSTFIVLLNKNICLIFPVNELLDISITIPNEKTIDCATLHISIANEIVNGQRAKSEHIVNIGRNDMTLLLNELRQIDTILGEYEKVEENIEKSAM